MSKIQNGEYKIFVDTGGTFTDCIGVDSRGKQKRLKVLSNSSLRGTITRVISAVEFEIHESWNLPRDLVKGFSFRILPDPYSGVLIESYDINEALESTLVVAKNEIKYVADVEKDFSVVPLIECIGSEINQVLLNILVNAAQAIESQRRSDRGLIRIRTYADPENLYCEISDDGPGIPQNIVSRIFDPFFTTKDAGEGTGLGLNISYDIVVHKHNGELSVQSEEGKGTRFVIELPVGPYDGPR